MSGRDRRMTQMKADNFSRARHFPAGVPVWGTRAPRVRGRARSPEILPQPSLFLKLLHHSFSAGFLLLCCLFAWVPNPVAAPAPSVAPAPPSWPIFRGNPALTGVAGDTLPQKPGLLWTFKTGGPVKSSAVIGVDKIFIGSDDGHLYALNFADGRQVWAFKAGVGHAGPAAAGQRLGLCRHGGRLVLRVDARAGGLLWKVQTDGKIPASANAVPRRQRPAAHPVRQLRFQAALPGRGEGHDRTGLSKPAITSMAPAPSPDGRAVFGGCDAMVHVLQRRRRQGDQQIDAGAYIARLRRRWRATAPTSAITTMNFSALTWPHQRRLALSRSGFPFHVFRRGDGGSRRFRRA